MPGITGKKRGRASESMENFYSRIGASRRPFRRGEPMELLYLAKLVREPRYNNITPAARFSSTAVPAILRLHDSMYQYGCSTPTYLNLGTSKHKDSVPSATRLGTAVPAQWLAIARAHVLNLNSVAQLYQRYYYTTTCAGTRSHVPPSTS